MGYHQNSSLISEEKSIARAFGNFGFNPKWEEGERERGGKGEGSGSTLQTPYVSCLEISRDESIDACFLSLSKNGPLTSCSEQQFKWKLF